MDPSTGGDPPGWPADMGTLRPPHTQSLGAAGLGDSEDRRRITGDPAYAQISATPLTQLSATHMSQLSAIPAPQPSATHMPQAGVTHMPHALPPHRLSQVCPSSVPPQCPDLVPPVSPAQCHSWHRFGHSL